MAIPTLVAFGAQDSGSGGNASTPMPAGIQADDWIFLVMESEGEEDSPEVLTDADFELVAWKGSASGGASDSTKVCVWKHKYNGSDTPSTAFSDPGNHWLAYTFAIRGGDETDIVAVSFTDSTGTNTNSQSVGPVGDSAVDNGFVMIVAAHGDNGNSTSTMSNANLDSITTFGYETSQGSDGTLLVGYGGLATQGEIGTFTWTTSSEERATVTMVLQEPQGGGTNYDETGKAFTITTTVSGSDDQAMDETGLGFTATITVSGSDTYNPVGGINYDETGKAFTVTVTVSGTDVLSSAPVNYDETGKQFTINVFVTGTDSQPSDVVEYPEWSIYLALIPSGSIGSLWDTGLWQGPSPPGAVWADQEPDWVEVTTDGLRFDTNMGVERWATRMREGTATLVLDNDTGKFNPDFGAAGPGLLDIRPGRWVQLRGAVGGVGIPVFTGLIDAMRESYVRGGDSIETTLTCIGLGALLSAYKTPAVTPEGGGERTDQRVTRLLDDTSWHPDSRDLQTGLHTMISTSLVRSAYEEIQRASDAEGGAFFFDAAGVPTFKARDWLSSDTRSTVVQMKPGSGLTSQPQVIGVEADFSLGRMYNDIQLSRSGGSAQRVQDAVSQANYGRRTYQRFDYEVENDTQVLALANQLLGFRKDDQLTIDEVTVFAKNWAEAQKVLETEIGDLLQVTVNTSRGWSYTVDVQVAGIRYNVNASDWSCTFRVIDNG